MLNPNICINEKYSLLMNLNQIQQISQCCTVIIILKCGNFQLHYKLEGDGKKFQLQFGYIRTNLHLWI